MHSNTYKKSKTSNPTALSASGNDDNLDQDGSTKRVYEYSVMDGLLLLRDIREKKLSYEKQNDEPFPIKAEGDEFPSIRENHDHILLLDPMHIINCEYYLKDTIKTITGKHEDDESTKNFPWGSTPRLIIAPLLVWGHWYAIRILIDDTNKASILWDDPFGRFGAALKEQLRPWFQKALELLEQNIIYNPEDEKTKSIDQQGHLTNGYDCGVIIFSNISDYCQINVPNASFADNPEQGYRINHHENEGHEKLIINQRASDVMTYRRIAGKNIPHSTLQEMNVLKNAIKQGWDKQKKDFVAHKGYKEKIEHLTDQALDQLTLILEQLRDEHSDRSDGVYSEDELQRAFRHLAKMSITHQTFKKSSAILYESIAPHLEAIEDYFERQLHMHFDGVLKRIYSMNQYELNRHIDEIIKAISTLNEHPTMKKNEELVRQTMKNTLQEHLLKKMAYEIWGIDEEHARFAISTKKGKKHWDDAKQLIVFVTNHVEEFGYKNYMSDRELLLITDHRYFVYDYRSNPLWKLFVAHKTEPLYDTSYYTGEKHQDSQNLLHEQWGQIKRLDIDTKTLEWLLSEYSEIGTQINEILQIEETIKKNTISYSDEFIAVEKEYPGIYLRVLELIHHEKRMYLHNPIEGAIVKNIINQYKLHKGLQAIKESKLPTMRFRLFESIRETIKLIRLNVYLKRCYERFEEAQGVLKDKYLIELWAEYWNEINDFDLDSAEYDYEGPIYPRQPEPYYWRQNNPYDADEYQDLDDIRNLIKICSGEDDDEDGLHWLVHSYVEYDFEMSEDVLKLIDYDQLALDEDIAKYLIHTLSLYRDYDDKEINQSGFIAQAYVASLRALNQDKFSTIEASNPFYLSKETIEKEIIEHFARIRWLNAHNKFDAIKSEFNQAYQNRNWQAAQKIWVRFTHLQQQLMRKESGFKVAIKKEQTLIKKAKERTDAYYQRIYPANTTRYLVYSSKKNSKEMPLDLWPYMSELKRVGDDIKRILKNANPKDTTNILVPMFFFVVSTKPHEKSGAHQRVFVPVVLDNFIQYQSMLLSKQQSDGVIDVSDTEFYRRISKEHAHAKDCIACTDEHHKTHKQEIIGLSRKPENLHHSERVFFALLKAKENIPIILKNLEEALKKALDIPSLEKGPYKIYSIAQVIFSSNSVCQYCSMGIISEQNSHENGFLKSLITLIQEEFSDRFILRGYDPKKSEGEPKKFNLDTFVLSNTAFTVQASDMAEDPIANKQHKEQPHKHNPKAKIYLPENTINVHHPVRRTMFHRHTFFEWVKPDIPKQSDQNFKFFGKTFKSGKKTTKNIEIEVQKLLTPTP